MNVDHGMPKIDINKLKPVEQSFLRFIEQQNLARVQKLKKIRRNNIITGCLLGVGIFSIYGYTILSVKQESFLDDFDEPLKTIENQ